MVNASVWVGLTLPGMIEEPGSFSGKSAIRPSPDRGPLPASRMSFAILKSPTARLFNAPCAKTSASCVASASNLLGAVTKGSCI